MFERARLVLALLVVFTGALPAQYSAARLQGTVQDASGAAVPNARINIQLVAAGTSLQTETNQAGLYVFPTLQPGKYRLTVESSGMETWQGDLELLAGQDAAFDPVLKVAGAATAITIVGDVTPLLSETGPTLSNVLERERIEQLPLDGRMVQNLLVLTVPGLEEGFSSASRPQAFGLRDGIVEFQQDGASLNDDNNGMITRRPPGLDTVQQYSTEMSVASARYERPITTVVSTRSGTNQWHGGLFYTGRNNGFGLARAREDYYANAPQLIRNEYGASLGGPVRLPHVYNGTDRTFFFFSWEGYKLRQATTISESYPTAAMRQGDFSQLTGGAGYPIALYDPWSTSAAAQGYRRTPFPNNQIPIGRLSPLAKTVYGVIPLPTLPAANPALVPNYYGPDPVHEDDNTYTVRIDHHFTERDQIFGRYTIGNEALERRYTAGTSPITADHMWNYQNSGETMQTPMATWNHVFSPRFFVETLGIWSDSNWKFCVTCPADNQDNMARLGLPNPFNRLGAPSLGNTGFGVTYIAVGQRAEDTQKYVAEQNYTLMQGTHQVRFGWHFQNEILDIVTDRPTGETLDFASNATSLYDTASGTQFTPLTRTGDNSANFFLGIAGSYTQQMSPGNLALRSRTAAGYVQDDWKIRPDLTLNFGLRYDYFPMLLDANGMNAAFDWANHAIVRTATLDQMIRNGQTNQAQINAYQAIGVKFETLQQAGWKGGLFHVGQLNFDPRVGLVHSRRIAGRTLVLRGGFGIFRTQLPTRVYQNATVGTPPLAGTATYNINAAAYSPDGLPNLGIRSAPTVIAGLNSQGVIDPNNATPIAPGAAFNTMDRNLPTTLVREWNITLESDIMRNTRLRVAWVGTQGRNLDQVRQYNDRPSGYVWYATTHQPLPAGPNAAVIGRDYDQTTYGILGVWTKGGYSNYEGMEVELQRRFSRGLAFQWFYVLSNAMTTGSAGETNNSTVPDPAAFLPGSVPTNYDQFNRYWNYRRDINIPHHRIRWNFVYELPVGRGKHFLPNAGSLLNRIAGGWQLSAYASMRNRYWALPTGNWGSLGQIQVYGLKYPVQDCRGTNQNATVATCIPGYLYSNGYIPASQINSHNQNGVPNGVMGVPANYTPSSTPLYPVPVGGCAAGDPNCGTNNVTITLSNGQTVRVAYANNGNHPWRQQYVPGPWNWTVVNASLFKVIPIRERLRLRINLDAFNALNEAGVNMPASATGIIAMNTSNNAPRVLQWTARLNW